MSAQINYKEIISSTLSKYRIIEIAFCHKIYMAGPIRLLLLPVVQINYKVFPSTVDMVRPTCHQPKDLSMLPFSIDCSLGNENI